MAPAPQPIVIVGAGLTGLACAVTLHEAGHPFLILEASDGVGGRVRTDEQDGFLLDRGFQVYLSAYPEAGKLLDLKALDLRPFEPGAQVFDGKKFHRVMDVFRRPASLVSSALSPIGSLMDKIRVALLRRKILTQKNPEKDHTTESYLKDFGFSKQMIDGFFRSFYGGIFLENELRTSSRMFEFTFRMFSEGYATLPAKGMGEIPKQLAARLPAETIRLNSPVTKVNKNSVTLENGQEIEASKVVIATEAAVTSKLVPAFAPAAPAWRSVTNFYYSAPTSPLKEAIIALNGSGHGRINNIAVLSDVSPDYAPSGQALISVSVLGIDDSSVIEELTQWFGSQVSSWKHLRTDLIPHALPEQAKTDPVHFREIDDILICGDHTVSASIEGAMISGIKSASFIAKS